MNYYYDLHIHSCLSPCGDDEMTPNNIVNMAFVKGLDIISVTDHNSCQHSRVIDILASSLGILAIPGMEIQTKEEVHMLCYFASVDVLEAFDRSLTPLKSKIKNNSKLFGTQLILDINDQKIGEVENALIMSINISIEELIERVETFNGAVVPAHVNKSSNSIIANLGFIPPDLSIQTIEVHQKSPRNDKVLGNFRRIYNSDAHYLENIEEPINQIEIRSKTSDALVNYLAGKDFL